MVYKLLVVDDEPIIRKGIIKLIDYKELAVGEIFEASDGSSALKIVEREHPEIILSDINMPVMDGLEFASKAKEINPKCKIAMITGYGYFDYAVTALKTGVDDFVMKPVSSDDIRQLLVKLIRKLDKQRSDTKVRESMETLTGLAKETGADTGYREEILLVIEKRYNDPDFSLKALANEVALSPGHLSTIFSKEFGIAFHDYLVSARLERAKILLLSTDMKNYEIAEQVGFEDPNYFSTAFKRRFGMAPSRYRATTGDKE